MAEKARPHFWEEQVEAAVWNKSHIRLSQKSSTQDAVYTESGRKSHELVFAFAFVYCWREIRCVWEEDWCLITAKMQKSYLFLTTFEAIKMLLLNKATEFISKVDSFEPNAETWIEKVSFCWYSVLAFIW